MKWKRNSVTTELLEPHLHGYGMRVMIDLSHNSLTVPILASHRHTDNEASHLEGCLFQDPLTTDKVIAQNNFTERLTVYIQPDVNWPVSEN